MFRFREVIRVTTNRTRTSIYGEWWYCRSYVDANTAQNCYQLEINFHFPSESLNKIELVLSWKQSVYMLRTPVLDIFYAGRSGNFIILLWWSVINLVITALLELEKCLHLRASFVLWFTSQYSRIQCSILSFRAFVSGNSKYWYWILINMWLTIQSTRFEIFYIFIPRSYCLNVYNNNIETESRHRVWTSGSDKSDQSYIVPVKSLIFSALVPTVIYHKTISYHPSQQFPWTWKLLTF